MNFNKFQQISTNFQSKSRAFTLIEMMVTLGIISVLTVMVIGYSRQSESQTNLLRESERLVYKLHEAQNSALQTLQESGSAKVCGWGIHVDLSESNTSYFLFADACVGQPRKYDTNDTKIETINVLRGVEIKSSNVLDIVFEPPEPKVFFNPLVNIAKIELGLVNQATGYYEVEVTKAGQISRQISKSSVSSAP
ncbi:MAG: Prepilin-type N-terminal cleavage/methylation protein [Patescibacteria group bacterium]|nr:Prepilin-type N-terminal cleavage/methylation protein [Patescibacteria group bacterium]